MGVTKTDSFTKEQNETASLLKALGHPARIAILEYLASQNTCITGQIVDELPLAQATVSQHLRELKSTGLISGEVSGTSVCYCINIKKWEGVKKLISDWFSAFHPKNCC